MASLALSNVQKDTYTDTSKAPYLINLHALTVLQPWLNGSIKHTVTVNVSLFQIPRGFFYGSLKWHADWLRIGGGTTSLMWFERSISGLHRSYRWLQVYHDRVYTVSEEMWYTAGKCNFELRLCLSHYTLQLFYRVLGCPHTFGRWMYTHTKLLRTAHGCEAVLV